MMAGDNCPEKTGIRGTAVLPYLARIYQQLYLQPGEEGEQWYPRIVQRGQDAPVLDLSHFRMNERDRIDEENTPAGIVQVITLHERADFEVFLQIMAHKCVPVPIPASQGAVILDGVINWQKIRQHQKEWDMSQGDDPLLFLKWDAEFKKFTSEKEHYKDVLIVLSTGPYSNVPASALSLSEEEWLERSYQIRRYHECTHFLCRKKYPDQISPVWDEVVADAVGITAAFGRFDLSMEERFFGIDEHGYIGGRLENYVDAEEERNTAARKIHSVLQRIEALYKAHQPAPFTLAMMLEEQQSVWWDAKE